MCARSEEDAWDARECSEEVQPIALDEREKYFNWYIVREGKQLLAILEHEWQKTSACVSFTAREANWVCVRVLHRWVMNTRVIRISSRKLYASAFAFCRQGIGIFALHPSVNGGGKCRGYHRLLFTNAHCISTSKHIVNTTSIAVVVSVPQHRYQNKIQSVEWTVWRLDETTCTHFLTHSFGTSPVWLRCDCLRTPIPTQMQNRFH